MRLMDIINTSITILCRPSALPLLRLLQPRKTKVPHLDGEFVAEENVLRL